MEDLNRRQRSSFSFSEDRKQAFKIQLLKKCHFGKFKKELELE